MKHVGRHTVVRELASSAVLSTFEATHEDGRAVRLRVFGPVVDLDDLAAQRLEDDLSSVGALRHLGIDKPVAWSAADPVHVSTVRVRGASLRDICDAASVGRIAPEVAAGVGADIAEALHAAHSAGLVHGGVSPDSILLGTDGRARVTDFGLMRCLNDLSFAQPQVMRGSIESLAPEQLSAPETVGPHTDVFGVGLALYRAMTGKPAFDAPSALGMSIRLSMGKPTPIDSHGVEVPDELRDLVMKMLSAAPAARPPMDRVARTLATIAGSWRDSVRALATSASPAQAEPESATGSPPAPGSSPPEDATPSAEPPRGAALSSADTPQPSRADSRADALSPWPTPPRDSAPAAPPLELATQPEIELPEAQSADDYATLFELHSPPSGSEDLPDDDLPDEMLPDEMLPDEMLPDEMPPDDALPDNVGGQPASRGDTRRWPSAEDDGQSVPKTVILKAPTARPPALSLPPERMPDDEPPTASEVTASAPEWAIWTAVALGAFALLIGTAALVILVTG